MKNLDQRNYSVVDQHYSMVPKADIPRSTFNRSHEHKTTGYCGELLPILLDEVLPGDVHSGTLTIFSRLGNLIFPLMDNAWCETQFFFVPCRILWEHWEQFMGYQANPGDSISYTIPQTANIAGIANPMGLPANQIFDYFGIPLSNISPATHVNVNALPLRAYNLIWNEWYRDQNLQDSMTVELDDGPDPIAQYYIQPRNKKHDYFTSCLPEPQKGANVTLPLGATAPVRGIGIYNQANYGGGPSGPFYESEGNTAMYSDWYTDNAGAGFNSLIGIQGQTIGGENYPNIYADLSQATAATINTLRLAVQTQKLLERDMRGGTRYTESLRMHWGVTPQDSRLQRPEYIGGGTTTLQTAAIAQTAPTGLTGADTPLGSLGGQSTMAGQHHFNMVAQEHGYIIGLLSIMTKPTYQQGLHRLWTRQTRFDLAWPEFANLGEQAVRNDEIYCQGAGPEQDTLTFGYQERFAEYRFANNRISGFFRSTTTGAIDEWHLAQKFATLPALNSGFVQENAPWTRVLAAGADAAGLEFIADLLFNVKTTRALPAYGVPGAAVGTF